MKVNQTKAKPKPNQNKTSKQMLKTNKQKPNKQSNKSKMSQELEG